MSSARIRQRILRLRELTQARGCTEAEALAAAEKAAQLMRDHGLSEADIVIDEQASASRQQGGGMKARLWPVIAYCTNTASIVISDASGTTVAFVGREPGPEIAVYLREICERAVDRELRLFKSSPIYRRQRKMSSKRETAAAFVAGMVHRLSTRLREVFGPSIDKAAREQAVAALDERYPSSHELARPKAPLGRESAAMAGFAAGNRVTLAHGVGEAAAPLAIGGGHG